MEDPEELDTRFSKFTPGGESDAQSTEALEKLVGAEEFMDLLNKVEKAAAGTKKSIEPSASVHFSITAVCVRGSGRSDPCCTADRAAL